MRLNVVILVIILAVLSPEAHAQRVAKYGADFLAGGVGARALGMGSAFTALADDVYAGYWNPAGLRGVAGPEIAYMHAERFAGVVSFDHAAYAWPLSDQSTVSVSMFRSGVNDIKNTLDAWDSVRDVPVPENITTFSAVDWAVFFGYGRDVGERLRVGATAKVIRRSIGDFAEAWGYSFDAGAQYRSGSWRLGVNVQDISSMLQSWTVNEGALTNLVEVFGDDMPEGGTELVLPVVRMGAARLFATGSGVATVSADVDVAFDGQQANAWNAGDVSFHPRVGAEYAYRDAVAVRAGLSRIQHIEGDGLDIVPTIGAGLHVRRIRIDYGFGDFAGLVADLGCSHRISVSFLIRATE
ncbi:MAG: PorV/PorQ family protein [Rhodothermales bacterium]